MIIGLTGGIGSGKSTVAQLFRDLKVPVIDSDQIVRAFLAPNQSTFKTIIDHFGTRLLQKDGSLDRTQLRTLIFQSDEERVWLENLLHPLVKKEILKQCASIHSTDYVVVEIPLLFEANFESVVDRILVVDCSIETQVERSTKRDNSSSENIKAIMKSQVTRIKRISHAHDIIENTNDIKSLKNKVQALHHNYIKLSK